MKIKDINKKDTFSCIYLWENLINHKIYVGQAQNFYRRMMEYVKGNEDERLIGLKKWYKDYMQCLIKTKDNKKIGLDKIVYTIKPVQKSNFQFSYDLTQKLLKEPKNLLEELKITINKTMEYLKAN